MKIDHPKIRRARIEMLPLIDIVFLVLVFFIYAMLSMAVHRGLPVVLPTSSTAKIDQKLLLSVSIKSDGTIYVDEEQVQIENLTNVLAERAKEKIEPGVLLFADHTIKYQQLFRVLDQIRTAGLRRISLQAEVYK